MEGYTLIDGIVAGLILLSAILAFSRGVVHETMAIAGWVVAAILGYNFAHLAQPLMLEIPVIGDFFVASCALAVLAAFCAIMVLALILSWFFTPLLTSLIHRSSALSSVDQGLGFLFGVARGVLLVIVAFFVYDLLMSAQGLEMVDNSRTATILAEITGTVEEQNPEQALGWFQSKYDDLLARQCS